jgi:flagellar basal body rod protein FlgB
MLDLEVFDSSFRELERSMQVATRRQEVIAHNIANAKTQGYEPMTFDEQLMKAVKRSDKKEVNLEEELSSLTENSIKYSAYVKMFTSKMGALRTVVTQGKK